MAIREGRWDCQSCNRVGNLGRDLVCKGCGDVRPEGVRFYLPENAPAVSDKNLLETARSGPDWICDFCEASNRAGGSVCVQCGADRDSKRQQQTRFMKLHEAIGRRVEQVVTRAMSYPVVQRHPRGAMAAVFAVPALALSLLLVFLCFKSYELEGVVSSVEWERVVRVEELRTEREEDWAVPTGGRLMSSRRAVHHYDQVLDHYETRTRVVWEPDPVDYDSGFSSSSGSDSWSGGSSYSAPTEVQDLGNGFFQDSSYDWASRTETYQAPVYRDEPVYRTMYTYDIDRWRHKRDVRATARNLQPYWPEFRLGRKEREGGRTETYTVHLKADGHEYCWAVPLDQFAAYRPGRKAAVVVNFFDYVRDVRLHPESRK